MVKQIEEEQAALNYLQELLKELLLKAQEDVIVRATRESQDRLTRVIFRNKNSGFQAGIINGSISGISFRGK